jgi:hypothetical protein
MFRFEFRFVNEQFLMLNVGFQLYNVGLHLRDHLNDDGINLFGLHFQQFVVEDDRWLIDRFHDCLKFLRNVYDNDLKGNNQK